MDGQQSDRSTAAAQPPPSIVQSFSADLDSMFGLESDLGQLEQTVEAKKQTVTSSHQQLQELEAKLRATEHRLSQVSRGNSPARQANVGAPRIAVEQPQVPQPTSTATTTGVSPLTQNPAYPADRPLTGGSTPQNTREDTQTLMSGMPGAMPQTPRQYSNNGDYVMVDRNGEQGERGGYGQSVR
ncbi:hypothetical protein LTR86_007306 [Recurvomyces mirabilis]|nr:hypothetical protein LTR86_007306 [Recurvomyces mirabilis]